MPRARRGRDRLVAACGAYGLTGVITYEIQPRGDICMLRVTHGGLTDDMSAEIWGGWPQILSSLKSLLETGESLHLEIPQGAIEEWQAERGAAGTPA